ncbi:MAG: cyclic lactone autoinducer peptide [Lachnospiraceae bacterium]
MRVKECVKQRFEKAVVKIARKYASVEANTACSCWGYQPKEPKQVKALRKF